MSPFILTYIISLVYNNPTVQYMVLQKEVQIVKKHSIIIISLNELNIEEVFGVVLLQISF